MTAGYPFQAAPPLTCAGTTIVTNFGITRRARGLETEKTMKSKHFESYCFERLYIDSMPNNTK